MPKKWLRRHLPNYESLGKSGALRPVGKYLSEPELWHLHRRSVSGAAFIGLFCAFLPLPFQSLIAALLAILTRCNLPMSAALVWITNPLTIPPMFYFAYRLGAWLLGIEVEVTAIELSWDWLTSQFEVIAGPLVVGSLVCGWVTGITAYVLVRVSWRLHVLQRWQDRRDRRSADTASSARVAQNSLTSSVTRATPSQD
jgi:uncharacterized protein (DUF2062 family)